MWSNWKLIIGNHFPSFQLILQMHEKPWAAAPRFNFLKCIRITFFKKLKMIGPNGNTKSAHCSWQHDKTRYYFTLGSFWYSKLYIGSTHLILFASIMKICVTSRTWAWCKCQYSHWWQSQFHNVNHHYDLTSNKITIWWIGPLFGKWIVNPK